MIPSLRFKHASRGGKSSLSNKPIFPQPPVSLNNTNTAKNLKLIKVEHTCSTQHSTVSRFCCILEPVRSSVYERLSSARSQTAVATTDETFAMAPHHSQFLSSSISFLVDHNFTNGEIVAIGLVVVPYKKLARSNIEPVREAAHQFPGRRTIKRNL